jgi:phage/plasmid-associated DNA primase
MLVDRAFKTKGDVTDCDIVLAASSEYREDQNCISQFAQEMLEIDKSGVLKLTQVWQLLTQWWKENGSGAKPKQKELKKFLTRKYGRPGKDKMWHGVKEKDFSYLDQVDIDDDE